MVRRLSCFRLALLLVLAAWTRSDDALAGITDGLAGRSVDEVADVVVQESDSVYVRAPSEFALDSVADVSHQCSL
jgi:hypothetical protein